MRQPSKWTGIVCAVVCVDAVVSVLVGRGVGLTAFGDITQCVLLSCATIGILSNTRTPEKKERLFWGLMGLGCGMWLCAQVLWTYFEVFLRQEVPNPFVADVVLFLHVVPMMAALVVQPHLRQNDHSLRLGSVDFFLLLTWWLYLYLFVVIPWQYVAPNEAVYGRSFDLLYACEQIVLMPGIGTVCRRSRALGAPSTGSFSKPHCFTVLARSWRVWPLIFTGTIPAAYTTFRWSPPWRGSRRWASWPVDRRDGSAVPSDPNGITVRGRQGWRWLRYFLRRLW